MIALSRMSALAVVSTGWDLAQTESSAQTGMSLQMVMLSIRDAS
jgi:hypothetical protein